MPVAITWSESAGGAGVASLDHGDAANGDTTSYKTIYLSHDGTSPITQCSFYFQQKASGYTGGFSGSGDFTEIKNWGDNSTASGHGGVQINMDPDNNTGWNVTTWDLTESAKQTAVAFTMYSGQADSASTGVTLNSNMAAGMTVNGEIPSGVETKFLVRFKVPTDEDTPGNRQLEQTLKYTFTS